MLHRSHTLLGGVGLDFSGLARCELCIGGLGVGMSLHYSAFISGFCRYGCVKKQIWGGQTLSKQHLWFVRGYVLGRRAQKLICSLTLLIYKSMQRRQ